jgi:hypothetical protein
LTKDKKGVKLFLVSKKTNQGGFKMKVFLYIGMALTVLSSLAGALLGKKVMTEGAGFSILIIMVIGIALMIFVIGERYFKDK